MNWLFGLIAKWTIGKKLLGAVGWIHDRLDGKKSEIILTLLALVHGLKVTGILSPSAAAKIEEVLIPILPVVLADRASKVIKFTDRTIPKP